MKEIVFEIMRKIGYKYIQNSGTVEKSIIITKTQSLTFLIFQYIETLKYCINGWESGWSILKFSRSSEKNSVIQRKQIAIK